MVLKVNSLPSQLMELRQLSQLEMTDQLLTIKAKRFALQEEKTALIHTLTILSPSQSQKTTTRSLFTQLTVYQQLITLA